MPGDGSLRLTEHIFPIKPQDLISSDSTETGKNNERDEPVWTCFEEFFHLLRIENPRTVNFPIQILGSVDVFRFGRNLPRQIFPSFCEIVEIGNTPENIHPCPRISLDRIQPGLNLLGLDGSNHSLTEYGRKTREIIFQGLNMSYGTLASRRKKLRDDIDEFFMLHGTKHLLPIGLCDLNQRYGFDQFIRFYEVTHSYLKIQSLRLQQL